LGLRMLSAISETVEIIHQAGKPIDLDALDFSDLAVYAMIGQADTIGVFQVESRAQAQMLPHLQPRCFNDLVVAISLIRPGPIQADAVHPYLRRRAGRETVTYAHPSLEPVLNDTLGVLLFQEDVLKIAHTLAGFSKGQGEQLRRALGAKQAAEEIERFHQAFVEGARVKGVSGAVAEAVFEQLRAFGSYSFPRSHAVAFAVIVYQSAWLKRYHPAPFYCGLLNNQPMGFWSPAVLIGDARRHKLPIWPLDLACSQGRCTVEQGGIRLGFNYVKGMGEESIARLLKARADGSFRTLADFCRRTRLPRRLVEKLILAGAMDEWGQPRRKLLWQLGGLHYKEEMLDLVFPPDGVDLPSLSRSEAFALSYEVLGLSAEAHLLGFYRAWLREQGILDSQALQAQPDGERLRVAGLVVVHQSPPTAKGVHFITLEDEFGLMDVVLWPQVYARYRTLLGRASLLLVAGAVQWQEGVVSLLGHHLAPFPGGASAGT